MIRSPFCTPAQYAGPPAIGTKDSEVGLSLGRNKPQNNFLNGNSARFFPKGRTFAGLLARSVRPLGNDLIMFVFPNGAHPQYFWPKGCATWEDDPGEFLYLVPELEKVRTFLDGLNEYRVISGDGQSIAFSSR